MIALALFGIVFIVARTSFCTAFLPIRPTLLCCFTGDSNVVTVVGLVPMPVSYFLRRVLGPTDRIDCERAAARDTHFAHVARIATR